jgi:hypothetical protein
MTITLMEAFDFTADDLAFNKRGQLSPGQTARFEKTGRKNKVLHFIITLGFGAGAYFTLLPFVLQRISITDNLGRLVGGVVLTGFALLFFYFLVTKDEVNIQKVQGKAQFVRRKNSRSSSSYNVVIGGQTFNIGYDKYEAFNQDHIYTIYNDVTLLGILSIEYIGLPEVEYELANP